MKTIKTYTHTCFNYTDIGTDVLLNSYKPYLYLTTLRSSRTTFIQQHTHCNRMNNYQQWCVTFLL
ncbi:hypothetical protein Hanom_Chr02g00171791 [Helianthus anomalus]